MLFVLLQEGMCYIDGGLSILVGEALCSEALQDIYIYICTYTYKYIYI